MTTSARTPYRPSTHAPPAFLYTTSMRCVLCRITQLEKKEGRVRAGSPTLWFPSERSGSVVSAKKRRIPEFKTITYRKQEEGIVSSYAKGQGVRGNGV